MKTLRDFLVATALTFLIFLAAGFFLIRMQASVTWQDVFVIGGAISIFMGVTFASAMHKQNKK